MTYICFRGGIPNSFLNFHPGILKSILLASGSTVESHLFACIIARCIKLCWNQKQDKLKSLAALNCAEIETRQTDIT